MRTTDVGFSEIREIKSNANRAASLVRQLLAFSRQHENEADKMGMIFMAMAGYDPNTAPKFWERMSSLGGGQEPPEFISTHPSHATRIKDLEGWIPEAMTYYKK